MFRTMDPADDVESLQAEMAAAIARQDYEEAGRIRDRLQAIGAPSKLRRETPGRMGLGTDQQRMRPPEGWTPPARPDPLTTGRKGRKGRR